MVRRIIALPLCALVGTAQAEPNIFGVPKGTKAASVVSGPDASDKGTDIKLRSVPRPHKLLKLYHYSVNKNIEICSISGSGEASGEYAQKDASAFMADLAAALGKGTSDIRFGYEIISYDTPEISAKLIVFKNIASF